MKELADVLNRALGTDSSKWKFESQYLYEYASNGAVLTSGYYNHLIVSSVNTGVGSSIELDTSSSAYDTLFTTTQSSSRITASNVSGTDSYILGQKTLKATASSPITLASAGETICLNVDGTKATLTLSKSSYTSLDELLGEINSEIANSSLNGKIKAKANSNRIQFVGDGAGISSITFQSNQGTAYNDLFVRVTYSAKYYSSSARGTTTKQQGTTAYVETPASLTLSYAVHSAPIVADSTNNTFRFTLKDGTKSITLTKGTSYTPSSLVSELNRQFADGGIGLTATLSGGKIKFTTTEKGEDSYLYINSTNNPAMMVLMEPTEIIRSADVESLEPAYILGKTQISSSSQVKIDTSNSVLNLTYKDADGSKSASLTVTQKTYTSASALATELNNQIKNSNLNGLVTAEATTNNVIKLVSQKEGAGVSFPSVSGGFYDNVLCKVTTASKKNNPSVTKGSTSFNESYVVGRADINNNMVEIKQGINDVLSIDFTYPDSSGQSKMITLETTIPAGTYTGTEIARLLTEGTMDVDGMDSFNEKLKEKGITDFAIEAAIGAHNTGVIGADDANITDEEMQYATLSILAQASQSILAQSNQMGQQEVAKLLGV